MTTGAGRTWQVVGPDGRPYGSTRPGMLGGNRRGRIYGRLDCRAALRALARGGYRAYRVFFLDEATAIAAGTAHARCACPGSIGDGERAV